ncbi:MAG: MqnA/MqnD/SBP family protein [Deltaproteobacteria bacterium]|nr:MqnA/MqnD/SBP family protein [Deltaproteobacteria bacterium]
MKIKIAHSPDADDAFMFYALTYGKINTDGLKFENVLQDIQLCNEDAKKGKYEVSAISFAAYPFIANTYALLNCGSSMGERNYGPVLVSKKPVSLKQLPHKTVAVPGTLTTATLLLKILCAEAKTVVMPFDKIMDAVKQDKVDVGLLIHEGQLTFAEEGLELVLNFGDWWYEKEGLPLPLGGNVIRRDIEPKLQNKIASLLKESIEYGIAHRREALQYAKQFSRGITTDEKKIDTFVGWYVNERTVDMGDEGRHAVQRLLELAASIGHCDPINLEFVGAGSSENRRNA